MQGKVCSPCWQEAIKDHLKPNLIIHTYIQHGESQTWTVLKVFRVIKKSLTVYFYEDRNNEFTLSQ